MLAPGVVHRAIATGNDAGVDLIDVDLQTARARFSLLTDNVVTQHGRTFGNTFAPAEWQRQTHALAVVNGGFFGESDGGFRSEVMGLLVQSGKVLHSARVPHAALLIDKDGQPQIAWASVRAGQRPAMVSAVGCGPMLVWNGKAHVTDRQERLASPGAQARTFVAIDSTGRHCVLGIASAVEYKNLAAFIVDYFPYYDHTTAGRAFCLDGGSSSQLTYRLPDGSVQSPRQTGTAVPVAVAILPR